MHTCTLYSAWILCLVMSDNLSDCPTRGWHELGRKRPQCTGQQFVHERLLAQVALAEAKRPGIPRSLTQKKQITNRRQGTGFEYHDEPQEIYKCMLYALAKNETSGSLVPTAGHT